MTKTAAPLRAPPGQLGLFDLDEGRRLRDGGLDRFEPEPWVRRARAEGRRICGLRGVVTTDDLRAAMELPAGLHPNAWGSVLRRPHFAPTGQRVQTKRPAGHARWIQVWRVAS